jgi:uncharacterized protein YeaO (DUF488 family)
MAQIKRVYETPASTDGFRALVDRLWPRSLSKAKVATDLGLKDLAPHNELVGATTRYEVEHA